MDKPLFAFRIITVILVILSSVFTILGIAEIIWGIRISWLWIAIIGFGVYVIITELKIKKLEGSKPSMELHVQDMVERGEIYLHVKNNGALGEFSGQTQIIGSSNDLLPLECSSYNVAWIDEPTKEIKIPSGHKKTIRIASFRNGTPPNFYSELLLHKYVEGNDEGEYWETTFPIGTYWPDATNPVFASLELTLSSSPPAKQGIKIVRIEIDAKEHVKGYENMDKSKVRHDRKNIGIGRKQFHDLLKKAAKPIKKSDKKKS
ncbi:hypothetical protein ACFLTJ_02430 [Chloroflexota bacterium]